HQAKNREFESVIVLWPLKLVGSLERKRRLLYNAVTRARGRAVVIVQDPNGKERAGALFTGGA
ncbi:MAG: ATP-binding domain-containing protein, partial [Deferrisomatales bacterium]